MIEKGEKVWFGFEQCWWIFVVLQQGFRSVCVNQLAKFAPNVNARMTK